MKLSTKLQPQWVRNLEIAPVYGYSLHSYGFLHSHTHRSCDALRSFVAVPAAKYISQKAEGLQFMHAHQTLHAEPNYSCLCGINLMGRSDLPLQSYCQKGLPEPGSVAIASTIALKPLAFSSHKINDTLNTAR